VLLNVPYINTTNLKGLRPGLHKILNPDHIIQLIDSDTELISNMDWNGASTARPGWPLYIAYRHAGGTVTNALFVDGHVEAIKFNLGGQKDYFK
jgi:prepilin-type processing-associated H-X9-DG protein